MDFSLTDKSKEEELQLEQWLRVNSPVYWLVVDREAKVFYAEQRLATRLGHHMMSQFLGLDLHSFLDPSIRVAHQKYFNSWWANPRPMVLRTSDDERDFKMFDKRGVGHNVYVKVLPLETHYCAGLCNAKSMEGTQQLAAAQIIFKDDLSRVD